MLSMYGGDIMFCNQCGKKNPDDALFCNSCGAKIDGAHGYPKGKENLVTRRGS